MTRDLRSHDRNASKTNERASNEHGGIHDEPLLPEGPRSFFGRTRIGQTLAERGAVVRVYHRLGIGFVPD